MGPRYSSSTSSGWLELNHVRTEFELLANTRLDFLLALLLSVIFLHFLQVFLLLALGFRLGRDHSFVLLHVLPSSSLFRRHKLHSKFIQSVVDLEVAFFKPT